VIEFIGPCGRVLLDSSFFRRGHGVGDGAREVISRNVLSKWVGPKTPPERGLLWARRPLAAALRQVTLQELEQGDLTWQSWQQGSEEGLFVQEACERVGASLAQRTASGPSEASGLLSWPVGMLAAWRSGFCSSGGSWLLQTPYPGMSTLYSSSTSAGPHSGREGDLVH